MGRADAQTLREACKFMVAHVAEVVDQLSECATAQHHEGASEEYDSAAGQRQRGCAARQRRVQQNVTDQARPAEQQRASVLMTSRSSSTLYTRDRPYLDWPKRRAW